MSTTESVAEWAQVADCVSTMSNIGFPFGGHDNQGWKLYLASLIMILFAGLFVIIRIIARMRTGKLGADDYAIILSLVSQRDLGQKKQTQAYYARSAANTISCFLSLCPSIFNLPSSTDMAAIRKSSPRKI
jgi:hypothetical protein